MNNRIILWSSSISDILWPCDWAQVLKASVKFLCRSKMISRTPFFLIPVKALAVRLNALKKDNPRMSSVLNIAIVFKPSKKCLFEYEYEDFSRYELKEG